MNDIPRGFCQCGCGQRTRVQKKANQVRKAGEPYAFVKGHYQGPVKHPTSRSRPRDKENTPTAPVDPAIAAVRLYRETKRERMPKIKAREAKILAAVKKAVAEADARAIELRHRGRPKSTKRLAPMFIRRSPDALIAAVPQWQGER